MNGTNGGSTSDDTSSGASGGGGGGGSAGCSGAALKKGPWTAAEDAILLEYVKKHGEGNWNAVQKNSGLSRCGKSCRLRWANHLRPNLKKGSFSPDEERLILELHAKLGNKWARMAAQLPGRTDNEIKNYWNTRVKRRQRAGLPLYPHDIQKQATAFHHHHHHHLHHPSPPSPSPPTHHPKPNFISTTPSLSLFDPINFSTTTNPHLTHHHHTSHFLSAPIHHQFKRFRDNNNHLGFSLPFSPPPPPPPSSLLSQSLSIQLPTASSFQFNPGNFDPNPPSIPPGGSSFSMKLELPSSQLPQVTAMAAASGAPNEFSQSLALNNSGLLDALLQEAQAMADNEEDMRKEGLLASQEQKSGLVSDTPPPLGSANQWDDPSPTHSSIGAKTKKEPVDEINSVDDDLSGFLDIIPSTMTVSEWYSDSGEMSNGQSSGVTDDEIGFEMQQLASSLSAATTSDHEWTLGSSWNNMPGIC